MTTSQGIALTSNAGIITHYRGLFRIASNTEAWQVGKSSRMLNLAQPAADPLVSAVTLRQAFDTLKQGLKNLPSLAGNFHEPAPQGTGLRGEPPAPGWSLLLDHQGTSGMAERPHLPYQGVPTAMPTPPAAGGPQPPPLIPQSLDALTVADDPGFLQRLGSEINLPDYLKTQLPALYR